MEKVEIEKVCECCGELFKTIYKYSWECRSCAYDSMMAEMAIWGTNYCQWLLIDFRYKQER